MIDALRPILGRLIAAVVTWIFGWLNNKFGIFVPADEQAKLVEQLIVTIVPMLITVYAVAHRLWDMHFNKSDAASPHLAKTLNAQHRRHR